MDRELIYVADPMCSWCYAFAPELQAFLATQDLPVRLVMGGLWTGSRAPLLDADLKAYLRETWARVASASGQPIALDILGWEDWVYNTEPACRAVVTMRALAPGHELRFFATLQSGFYADNFDLTDELVYPNLLDSYPVDVAEFVLTYRSSETAEATRADFEDAKRLGVLGFPTLMLRSAERITPLARGYTKASQVAKVLRILGGAS